jgi:isopentenyl diphosphate isomerase/L-lactate dehydrogenase-like FMN-dependent dehydrogenase
LSCTSTRGFRGATIDLHDHRIALIGQLHQRARGVHAHHADEAAEHGQVELAAALREQHRHRLVRRQRDAARAGVAQVVVTVDQRHQTRRRRHAIERDALRKPRAVGQFVMLRQRQQRALRWLHLAPARDTNATCSR